MTTFVDPFGITATIAGKTGIVELSASNSPVVAIPRDCGWMVAVISGTTGNPNVSLPSDAVLGDIVEVYFVAAPFGGNLNVLAPTGESIISADPQVSISSGHIFRKIGSSVWAGWKVELSSNG